MVNSRARPVTFFLARYRAMKADTRLYGMAGLMLDGGDLGSLGQDFGNVAAPRCRVLAVSQFENLGVIQHTFDATTHPVCRFRRGCPDGLDHLEHEGRSASAQPKRKAPPSGGAF